MEQDYTWEYKPVEAMKDARWEQEVFITFYVTCIKAANDLWRQNKGGALFEKRKLTADPATVAMLESISHFKINEEIDYTTPLHKVGEIEGFEVFRDAMQTDNKATIEWCERKAIVHVKGLDKSSVGTKQ